MVAQVAALDCPEAFSQLTLAGTRPVAPGPVDDDLPELEIPTLVVHGRHDPFFPVGNGEALAREIPGARLPVLGQAATAIPAPPAIGWVGVAP